MNEKITITNGNDKTLINFIDLENVSGYGDYLYYNNQNYTIGFSWSRKNSVLFDNIYFLKNYKNGETDCKDYLINITRNKKYKITLSDKDYKTFLNWFNLCSN